MVGEGAVVVGLGVVSLSLVAGGAEVEGSMMMVWQNDLDVRSSQKNDQKGKSDGYFFLALSNGDTLQLFGKIPALSSSNRKPTIKM